MNKESILAQIDIVESNVRRLRTLIEADLVAASNLEVPIYCLMTTQTQVENLLKELKFEERSWSNKMESLNPEKED